MSVNIRSRQIWKASPAFSAFRGFDWMEEPCPGSCDRREQDFGGCRCQAFLITGERPRGGSGLPPLAASRPHRKTDDGA